MQRQGFSRVAVFLHWLMAVSIFFLFISSWWMMGLPLPSPELQFRAFPFQLHKNIGLTLIIVILMLLYVRLIHRPAPVANSEMKPWMHTLAVLAHVMIYVLVLGVSLTGYLSSAHTRWDTVFWWTFEFPRIAPPDEEMNEFWGEMHMWVAWALLGIVAVHISGAIYHAFRNDGIVRRMLRW